MTSVGTIMPKYKNLTSNRSTVPNQISPIGISWSCEQWEIRSKTTWQELVDYLKSAGTTVTMKTIVNNLHHSACKACLLKMGHVQTQLKFVNEHLQDIESDWEKLMWSDETKMELFCINSTFFVFEGWEMLLMTPRTPSPLPSTEVETLCFGVVFLQKAASAC